MWCFLELVEELHTGCVVFEVHKPRMNEANMPPVIEPSLEKRRWLEYEVE